MMRLRSATGGLIAVLAVSDAAFACKCAVVPRAQVIGTTPVVFEGRVVNIRTSGKAQVTTVRVLRAIKGVSGGATIKVRSGTQAAACGYDFRDAGKALTVGGERAGHGTLSVRRCTMVNLNP